MLMRRRAPPMTFFPVFLTSFRALLFSLATFASQPQQQVEGSQSSVPRDIVAILENSTLYDYHASPTQNLGIATNVSISMYIEGLSSFSAQTMDFHVDIYLQERWVDPRLKHRNKNKILIKDIKLFNRIWHPDLYFANAREASFHDVTAPNFLCWIYPDGSVYYDTRVSLKVMCMMDLAKYPLDLQRCHIRILSYAYDDEQLNITWISDSDPITKNEDIMLPDMHLLSIKANYCDGYYVNLGRWSCLTVHFVVRREIMQHFLQSYIPTALIVAISWFSFWLDVDSVPGRITLCITTLLTLATQASAARLSLPQVSYIKAIDVWLGACLAFVFAVMIEFTFVNYLSRRKESILDLCHCCRCTRSDSEEEIYPGDFSTIHRPNSENVIWTKRCNSTVHWRRPSQDASLLLQLSKTSKSEQSTDTTGMSHHNSKGKPSATTPSSCGCDSSATEDNQQQSSDNNQVSCYSFYQPKGSNARRNSAFSSRQGRKLAIKIDRYCRSVFPIGFLFFNLLYWPYYILSPTPYIGNPDDS